MNSNPITYYMFNKFVLRFFISYTIKQIIIDHHCIIANFVIWPHFAVIWWPIVVTWLSFTVARPYFAFACPLLQILKSLHFVSNMLPPVTIVGVVLEAGALNVLVEVAPNS